MTRKQIKKEYETYNFTVQDLISMLMKYHPKDKIVGFNIICNDGTA